MRRTAILLLFCCSAALAAVADDKHLAEARAVITQFHEAIIARDVQKVEEVVWPELVVLENGHRNEGWANFRDEHLIPELQHDPGKQDWKFHRVVAKPEMAWGYTECTITLPDQRKMKVWSAFVLERREGKYKIALLDWSVLPPPRAAAR